MALSTTCPSCGLQGRFPDEWKGRSIDCPRCHSQVTLGDAAAFFQSPPAGPVETAPDRTFVMSAPAAPTVTVGGTEVPERVDTVVPLAPPPAATGEDDPTHQKWVGEETQRFKAYVTKQLAALRQKRHELAALQSQQEVKLVGREHDLNRLQTELDAKDDDLRQREEAVAKRLDEVRQAAENLTVRERELREQQARREAIEREIADLSGQRTALRAEVDRLRESIAAVHQQLQPLDDRRRELLAEQSVWETRVAQWERQHANLEREEQALQHRTAEVHELEEQIERELQERTRELDHWQRLLEERERKVAQTTPVPRPATPPKPSEVNRSAHGQP